MVNKKKIKVKGKDKKRFERIKKRKK